MDSSLLVTLVIMVVVAVVLMTDEGTKTKSLLCYSFGVCKLDAIFECEKKCDTDCYSTYTLGIVRPTPLEHELFFPRRQWDLICSYVDIV